MGSERTDSFLDYVKDPKSQPEWEAVFGGDSTVPSPEFTEKATPVTSETTAELADAVSLKRTRNALGRMEAADFAQKAKAGERPEPWYPSLEAVRRAEKVNKPKNHWDNPDNRPN